MAATVPSLQGANGLTLQTNEGVHLFGVRHLSPAGAWHLLQFLDKVKPRLVLIEGPADGDWLIKDVVKPDVKPPLAILSYTTQVPVQSAMYPLAEYSPEYQAMCWAASHRVDCRFCDLPSRHTLPLYRMEEQDEVREHTQHMQQLGDENAPVSEWLSFHRYQSQLYHEIAKQAGEADYDSYWERNFEHNLDADAYRKAVSELSSQMREMTEGWEKSAAPLSAAVNALRESHMKRCVKHALDSGIEAEQIVVVCGAYHVAGLIDCSPMTDDELAAIPMNETKMTLMPYSYYKLSTFSGYGAGNHAPYYFELMWDAMKRDKLDDLPAAYLARVSAEMRSKQGYSSPATVIDAVRLAQGLQYLHGGRLPTLCDLHHSAISAMSWGEPEAIAPSFAKVDIGTNIGELPEGVSQTPIQDDMNRHLKRLKLEKYKSVVAQTLPLDLREQRRSQSEKSAFLDLDRSTFLHRLAFLGIDFAKKENVSQLSASWAERWILCWTPEVEIQIVESVLYGDTIESAASYLLRERLRNSEDVLEVANLVSAACECQLTQSIFDALQKLQTLTAESVSLHDTAQAARKVSLLLQYGSLRRFETAPLEPVIGQLFLKATLLLLTACGCDDDAARVVAQDMTQLHLMTQEHDELVSDETWLRQLQILAKSDNKNPVLCGFAFSILMERGKVGEDEFGTEMSRYLSPGSGPETGARWFEGLSLRNRYLLLSRPMLWRQLDEYLEQLDDEEFKRSLICLRRAFSSFESQEKSGVCELLAEVWGVDAGSAAELLQDVLSQDENTLIDGLNDFDFGDLL